MSYTDQQILDLIEDLGTVGHSETPNEELKRLLREWEQGSPVYQMGGKTPAEIEQIQREFLGVVPDGFVGVTTKEAVYKWSTAAFYLWLKSRGKEAYILEVGGTSSYSAKYMVLYKEYAACFRRREVLPTTGEKIIEAGYSYYKLWDEIPPELNFPGTSH
jgi:hypothetical protein